jgi:hypothetical protein
MLMGCSCKSSSYLWDGHTNTNHQAEKLSSVGILSLGCFAYMSNPDKCLDNPLSCSISILPPCVVLRVCSLPFETCRWRTLSNTSIATILRIDVFFLLPPWLPVIQLVVHPIETHRPFFWQLPFEPFVYSSQVILNLLSFMSLFMVDSIVITLLVPFELHEPCWW